MIDRFAAADRLQEWALNNGYGMPLRDAMAAVDVVLSPCPGCKSGEAHYCDGR